MEVLAPAKFNRFLAVLGRRPDEFHALELVTTVLEGVPDLTDRLMAEPAPTFCLRVEGPRSAGLEATEDNLVARAWRLLEAEVGRALPARVTLHKRIPHGAGLGGGSSDAAAALRLGNAFFGLRLPQARLLALAGLLGSDVPLFLLGGTVLGLDRGERVLPLRELPLEPLLLVHPGLHVPTPSVYKALAAVGYPPAEPCPGLAPGEAPPWRNDLTAPALWVCPELAEVRDRLADLGGEPLLCGSGSCWAARFSSARARDDARERLQHQRPEWSAWEVG